MDSAESDPRPASDWTNALDAIAVDIVRSLTVPPAAAPPPPVPEAPVAETPQTAPEAEPARPLVAAAPEPEAAVPADVPTPPAAREEDAEGLGEAIRHLTQAGTQLDRLQACVQQAEQKAALATGQLAIETELLQRFREELAEARQRMAAWPARAAG